MRKRPDVQESPVIVSAIFSYERRQSYIRSQVPQESSRSCRSRDRRSKILADFPRGKSHGSGTSVDPEPAYPSPHVKARCGSETLSAARSEPRPKDICEAAEHDGRCRKRNVWNRCQVLRADLIECSRVLIRGFLDPRIKLGMGAIVIGDASRLRNRTRDFLGNA